MLGRLDPVWRYVFWAYLAFWAIILVLGGVASVVFGAPPALMTAVVMLGSWSPSIVLLIMLRSLKPGMTIGGFYRHAFRGRLDLPTLMSIPLIVFGVLVAALWILSMIEGKPFGAYVTVPSGLGLWILLTALMGPSGEESGWRGYLRPELEERHGFFKGNVILGLVWAFWHVPLWFIDSDYGGWQAVVYIGTNIVVLTALTLIMAVYMRRSDNLLIAFWVHFCFNLGLSAVSAGLSFFVLICALFVAAAWAVLRMLPPARVARFSSSRASY